MKLNKTLLALALSTSLSAVAGQEHRAATYVPDGGYLNTTDAKLVAASSKKRLQPGQKVAGLTALGFAGDAVVQRLTGNTYWVQVGFYSTVFYVGDTGVLVLDPIGYGASNKVLAAIKKITNQPVTAVVYSHHHEDHIGDIDVYVKAAKQAGIELRIIATAATAKKMQEKGSELPQPTQKIGFVDGATQFEGVTLRAKGFVNAAHDEDSAVWLLEEEKVAHIPDMINPNQMPWMNFGGSKHYAPLADNIRSLAQLNWDFFSGGHGNVGAKADIKFMLNYLQDLESAIAQARKASYQTNYYKPEYGNHQASAAVQQQFVIDSAMATLRKKYGEFYGFEASVPEQIRMVMSEL